VIQEAQPAQPNDVPGRKAPLRKDGFLRWRNSGHVVLSRARWKFIILRLPGQLRALGTGGVRKRGWSIVCGARREVLVRGINTQNTDGLFLAGGATNRTDRGVQGIPSG